ncbi:pre-rRNA-processing protein TSR1 homolog [Mya arenaria]|uniref:pre-rRNA-processing protein TSR1 homolog n=1 Tax=Mya arenaria TaxID=6604 RepID=UPI0022E076DC|nr:pre-rRNA-processing protein TSR1 homolog [Mya arenaria]
MIVHRPGPLKQQNKTHKHGKHRSKSQREEGGRVSVKTISKKATSVKRKNDRKHQSSQHRKQKREEAFNRKRSVGCSGTPPHCVLVLALHSDVDVSDFVKSLLACDDTLSTEKAGSNITHVSIPRFKQRLEILTSPYGNLYSVLDGAKSADSLVLVVSPDKGVDSFGEGCLSCLLGQGMPAVTIVTKGLKSVPQKKQKDIKKQLQKTMERWFPDEKVHTPDSQQEFMLILRQITSQKLRDIHFRENRAYLMSEHVSFEVSKDSEEYGTLKVTGYVRSRTLNTNRLVHVTGLGDFQLSQVDLLEDPHPLQPRKAKQDVEMAEGSEPTVLSVVKPDPAKQEGLLTEAEIDPMEGEQTWPTEEELAQAEASQKQMKRRVPKGTSDYQASWILEDEDAAEGDVEMDEGSDADMEDDIEAEADIAEPDSDGLSDSETGEDIDEDEEEEEYEEITVGKDEDAHYDEQMDMQEELSMLEKLKKEKMHVTFPDEVDTPQGVNARTRFQKYRGLKSFRTSPWDPKENLPLDYARIFQFNDFRRMSRKILKAEDDEEESENSVLAWSYVRLHIANVPKDLYDELPEDTPLQMFSLLPHEHKMSVLNIVLHKTHDLARPIQSKDRLTFHIGCRRFTARPIFSQHTNGNKHKFEKFLPREGAVVATIYAPITFPPAPVLVFQDRPFGGIELVAKGSLMSVNPDRVITKRAVISGYPLKINKRSCVVRYMFFNREDIEWFKPVELRTKWGRRGHIKVPLGTHGHMKVVFDGQLKSQDTILMNLYKRVFPKWSYSQATSRPKTINKPLKVISMETIEEATEAKEGAAFALFD